MIRCLGLVVILVIVLAASVQAKDFELAPSHHWNAGVGCYNFSYRENEGHNVRGFMMGAQASYTTRRNNNCLKLDASYYGGMPTHTGLNWNGEYTKAINDDHIKEGRVLVGKERIIGNESLQGWYTGLGCRYWYNNPKAEGLFCQHVTYFYTPIIYESARRHGDTANGFKAEFDWLWNSTVKSEPSWFSEGYNNPVNHANQGCGFRTSYYMTKRVSENRAYTIEPYVQYWNVGKSDTVDFTRNNVKVANFSESENSTVVYGLNLNWEF